MTHPPPSGGSDRIFRLVSGLMGLCSVLLLGACEFKLPSPPPKLFYKYYVAAVGAGPSCLISADLNQDGEADIVSANTTNSSISILFGKGDGVFESPLTLRVAAEPSSLAAGDLNHDGIIDLVVNARGADAVTILLGKKNGSFAKRRILHTGRVPLAVILDDFNNDGHLDIAVTLTFNKMEIYLGRGNGKFKKGATYSTGSRSFSGVTDDFTGDGRTDIALAVSSAQSSSIRIFPGNGDGTFSDPIKIAEGLAPLVLIKEDMNGDGIVDLVFASGKGDNLYLLLSNGDGTFQEGITFSGGGGPMALVAGHFNEDDRIDVAVANSRSSTFSLAIRNPGGNFHWPTRDYVVDGGTVLAITAADFNDDGLQDIAVAGNAKNSVEVYLQKRIFR